MLNLRNKKKFAACAGLVAFALVVTLTLAVQAYARKVSRSITIDMPACPITAQTVPPTRTKIQFPRKYYLDQPTTVTGFLQFTDQTSSTILLLQTNAGANQTGISFSRTVRDIQHATGEFSFGQGCSRTDPYGSNNCFWEWGDLIDAAYSGALQENVSNGRMIGDFVINGTIPLQFTCSICGSPCTFTIPQPTDHGRWDHLWDFVVSLLRHQPDDNIN